MKYVLLTALLGLLTLAMVPLAFSASVEHSESYYDSRNDRPYRSPHNSGSLYSDGGTEGDRYSGGDPRMRNYETRSKITSSGSYDKRAGGVGPSTASLYFVMTRGTMENIKF